MEENRMIDSIEEGSLCFLHEMIYCCFDFNPICRHFLYFWYSFIGNMKIPNRKHRSLP